MLKVTRDRLKGIYYFYSIHNQIQKIFLTNLLHQTKYIKIEILLPNKTGQRRKKETKNLITKQLNKHKIKLPT